MYTWSENQNRPNVSSFTKLVNVSLAWTLKKQHHSWWIWKLYFVVHPACIRVVPTFIIVQHKCKSNKFRPAHQQLRAYIWCLQTAQNWNPHDSFYRNIICFQEVSSVISALVSEKCTRQDHCVLYGVCSCTQHCVDHFHLWSVRSQSRSVSIIWQTRTCLSQGCKNGSNVLQVGGNGRIATQKTCWTIFTFWSLLTRLRITHRVLLYDHGCMILVSNWSWDSQLHTHACTRTSQTSTQNSLRKSQLNSFVRRNTLRS